MNVKVIDGLDNFPALETLTLKKLIAETLNLDKCVKLKALTVSELNKLKEVVLGNCPVTVFSTYLGGRY